METIKAVIDRVIADKGSWCAIVAHSQEMPRFNASGLIIAPMVGEDVELVGEWKTHPKYGPQFHVEQSKKKMPVTEQGITEYLCSGFINGIGPKTAVEIVKRFGLDTLNVISKSPMELVAISGITTRKAEMIHDCHMRSNIYAELAALLKPTVSDKQIANLYSKYGDKAVSVITENPYVLIDDMYGIGFRKADVIATAIGIAPDAKIRIRAGILYCLKEKGEKEGHCYIGTDALEKGMKEIIGDSSSVDMIVEELICLKNKNEIVIEDEDTIYLKSLYLAENDVADYTRRLIITAPKHKVKAAHCSQALEQMEAQNGFVIEGEQREAVFNVFEQSLSAITGGPGTGKSTITKAIVTAWVLAGHPKESIALCAPTGRAARRMTEVTGLPATTIHRLLGFGSDGFKYDEKRPLFQRLIIVDECSMMDIYLAKALLSAIRGGATIIMIGDVDQLHSIGAGNVFRDFVQLEQVPTIRLKLSHRQHGKIAINANMLNHGSCAFEYDDTFQYVNEGENHELLQKEAVDQYLSMADKYGIEQVCLLTPMRQRGASSVNILNPILRELVNPPSSDKAEVVFNGKSYLVGDRVMQTKNRADDGIANGDLGFIASVCESFITVEFDSFETVEYLQEDVGQLVLAYAMTIHKSQGSEYKGCVVVASNEHYIMLQRNLIYTAVTRAKEEVVLVGNMRSFELAAKTVKSSNRNTKLQQRIVG